MVSLSQELSFKILVVEDNPINQLVLEKSLSSWGFSFVSTNNGRSALKAVEEHGPFNLVLLDLLMPEMDGFETARQLKRLQQDLPIVAITASNLPVHKEAALQAGAIACLFKPYRSGELKIMIDQILFPAAN